MASIDAGIFFTRPFTDGTADDCKALVSMSFEGFLWAIQFCAGLSPGTI
jgi:hypothetical protein